MREARRSLAACSRSFEDFDFRRYFRDAGHLGFYNTGANAVRELSRAIAEQHRGEWRLREALAFAGAMLRDRHLEMKALGIGVLAGYRREFTPRLLPVWKRWLAGGCASNWATTDDICGHLIGPLLRAHPRLVTVLASWSTHRSLWVRRASAVGLLASIRAGEALDEAYAVARTLHADEADLIQKAVGWMLREAGKMDASRLERYLLANGPSIPRTTVRYAIERFPARKRRKLLNATIRSSGTAAHIAR